MPLKKYARSFAHWSVGTLLLTCVSGAAFAYDKRTCATAYEAAQQLRLQLKLKRAREQLAICAHSTCPGVVTSDCTAWLKEVDTMQPSVVLRLRDERGRNVTAIKVWVDGEFVLDDVIGSPIMFDPGLHTIRIDAEGFASLEQKLLLRTGDRNYTLEATLKSTSEPPTKVPEPARESKVEPRVVPDAPFSNRPPAAESQRATLPPEGNTARTAMFVTGAAGVISLASFSYFALSGTHEANELRATCAPNCPKADVDATRTKLVFANVSLGVGLGAIAVAGVLWLTHASPPLRSASTPGSFRFDVRPTALGSGAEVLTTFSAP